jgi:hypothetical protein
MAGSGFSLGTANHGWSYSGGWGNSYDYTVRHCNGKKMWEIAGFIQSLTQTFVFPESGWKYKLKTTIYFMEGWGKTQC